MAPMIRLFAASLMFFSSALAFSQEQCNLTSYGAPNKAACNTLLTTISKLGGTNTSYLFIPSQFSTPEGLSNGTRKNFPVSWNTTGCNAALVPVEVAPSSVTYDTSTYPDLAATGRIIIQQCLSNKTGAGGWELAGDTGNLVLHLYASGSEIDSVIKQQRSDSIAATSEDEIDDAALSDPDYTSDNNSSAIFDADGGEDDYDTATGIATDTATATASTAVGISRGPATATATATGIAEVVESSGTFSYFGCQLDSTTSRTLSSLDWSGTGLTVERCATYCAEYQYMGVEFGSQCYCGGDANGKGVKPATLINNGKNNCTTPCNGDATQICGGAGWLTTYQNSNSATAGQSA